MAKGWLLVEFEISRHRWAEGGIEWDQLASHGPGRIVLRRVLIGLPLLMKVFQERGVARVKVVGMGQGNKVINF